MLKVCAFAEIFTHLLCLVSFGVKLKCIEKAPKIVEFSKKFDESLEICHTRFLDSLWKIKKFLQIGDERKLAQNAKWINEFVYKIIDDRQRENVGLVKNPF